MKKVGIFLTVLFFSSCTFFAPDFTDVKTVYFTKDAVVLSVVPDYELRTLAVSYGENSSGVIGGNFFDRLEDILTVFDKYPVSENDIEGSFIFSVEKLDGDTKKYIFALTDESDEFGLVNSFYVDVSDLFLQEVY